MFPHSFYGTLDGHIENGVLYVSCEANGRTFSTAVNLAPIAARVREAIRRYHATVLHGDLAEETIAGLGSWYRDAVHSAARIANAKAAGQLWKIVKDHHGDIETGLSFLPGGSAISGAMKTGFTIQNMLHKAKTGDPTAIDDVTKISKLADSGDPQAQQVMKTMAIMNKIAKAKKDIIGGSLYSLGLCH